MEKRILQQIDPKILGGRLQEARKACGLLLNKPLQIIFKWRGPRLLQLRRVSVA